MYKNLRKIASIAVAILIFAPGSTQAALTVGSTTITSDAALTMNAVANTADAIYLHANGGTSETIKLHADQGTGVDSINLLSDAGGITLQSSLASADAINLDATVGGLDIDALTGLAINVSSATVASNITIAVNADAEDLTISTTGSAGDIFITSADDLTLTGSPIALSSTGNITANTNISITNGAVVYNDNQSSNITDCSVDGDETVNLSLGNYFIIYGSETQNCAISFSNGTQGGLYMLKWVWQGAHDFNVSRFAFQLPRTSVKQVCEADGSTLDDASDEATMLIIMRNSADPDFVSCTVNIVQD
jgi:hypothetical protein